MGEVWKNRTAIMGKIVLSKSALSKLNHIKSFYAQRDPKIGDRAVDEIEAALLVLLSHPEIGRPFEGSALRRELVIPFGSSGFISLYEIDKAEDRIVIVALRHQREDGFKYLEPN
jgi:plasmid stabilization system protein ParE